MKDLIIVGAGGMARKVFTFLRRLNESEKKWNIIGCIDDNQNALDGVKFDLGIIGTISDWQPTEDQVFVMGISDPKLKHKISDMMLAKGAKFETIVSPEVIMGDYVEIGEGSVILTPYNVESGAKIGRFVTLLGSTIALDGVIGDYSTTAGFANLTNAKIGKEVYVGSHAVLVENITVGDGAFVSVGSIVLKDVKPNEQVFGYPARVVGRKDN
ncbi:MAG: acetyltransferase [Ruminococcus sp.]|uniref:PglD-related sugar-binding protein n=1 Tax=Ruminococcus sp. TaxID=41978 RepID=UPI001569D4D4|nr:acetyltransferase [Ruminococcus sp.]MCR5601011.1 acetyltransferase [Ruminococcus sp.]